MITIDLTQALDITIPDAKGVKHAYELKEGLNDVPPEVAEHWYVKKFMLPVRRVPRTVVPSSARRAALPKPVIEQMAKAIAPLAEAAAEHAAPHPEQTAEVPAAKDEKAKA